MPVRQCHSSFLYQNTACVANKHLLCVSRAKGTKFSSNRVVQGSYYWARVTALLSTFVLHVGCPLREEKWQRRALEREGDVGNCACLLVSRGRQLKETGYNPWVSKSRQLIYFSPIFRSWFVRRTRNLFKVSLLKGLKCKK